jgi:hypothetical protein
MYIIQSIINKFVGHKCLPILFKDKDQILHGLSSNSVKSNVNLVPNSELRDPG